MSKILIVEDDVAFCTMLKTFLQKKDYEVSTAYSGNEAIPKIKQEVFDLVLTDVRLPDNDGIALLDEILRNNTKTQVIIMTGYAEIDMAVNAIKQGAFDYVSKPFNPDKILDTIEKALSFTSPSEKENNEKRVHASPAITPKKTNDSFVRGVSDASKKLNEYVALVAPTRMSVLVIGDSGTGKEYVASSIHKASKRADKPFIAVDCGAIPKELASSEFFGHIKGSFTGAVNDKVGHFEAANGGTLFLDEIGNLNYELQVQLLRALQERKIKPVGSNKEIEVDIRVIVATNEDLSNAVKEGEFREDLYHRLNEFSIKVPPFKDRIEDLMLFANHFLEESNTDLEKNVVGFTDEVLEAFKKYTWPGNLRELKNIVKRSVLLSQNDMIVLDVLPNDIAYASHNTKQTYGLFKNQNEQELILDALEKANGNKAKAARMLSIDRKTLYNKLKQYDISL
ncbi:sigma-54-dependent transcriptional regulator [Aquimarina muelleri]|uniref:Sigma-54-dependent Fis family transcriptional regulator n=1 Tax=Aquimarina muelleri TaxID=279356 RepID=A0A918JS57_9FLAO|nr:sigma-54 dependent transcriptional regulator [Aquimarina muelleri]MCX2761534.1 sigma-54 dependent transcriptional regulator [Aquimarina muelleri]GGX07986.1 sigma-54-dependent Fis family transcriptional regulator [Aquimarina muelleri]